EPRLGGEGSGAPPPYYVATGQTGHAIVGVDLGTAFSRLATVHQGRPVMVKPDFFPSVVQVTPNGGLIGGTSGMQHWDKAVSSLRPKIGSGWRFDHGNISYSPEDLTTALLTGLKRATQVRLEREISKAVLTVPTSYTSAQRHLFKEAA